MGFNFSTTGSMTDESILTPENFKAKRAREIWQFGSRLI